MMPEIANGWPAMGGLVAVTGALPATTMSVAGVRISLENVAPAAAVTATS
jgi:hypothetical protein